MFEALGSIMDRRYKKRIKRYWSDMESKAIDYFDNIDLSSWFDYAHCHLDWKGKGDSRPENRVTCLELGYKIFQLSLNKCEVAKTDIQTWWSVHEESYDDAIYLHSENDNGTPYPYIYDGIVWNTKENELLTSIVDLSLYKIGVIKNSYGTTFIVAKNA